MVVVADTIFLLWMRVVSDGSRDDDDGDQQNGVADDIIIIIIIIIIIARRILPRPWMWPSRVRDERSRTDAAKRVHAGSRDGGEGELE